MKVIIAGSTGMIGSLILDLCLRSERITEIVNLVRKTSILENKKVQHITIENFENYDEQHDLFKNVDIAFFCIGVYTGQVPKDLFKKITVDYAVTFAEMLQKNSPNATLCMLSGAGADRTEKSKTNFARFKGMAENKISKLGLDFYTFRPGYIYPVTPRKEPNILYRIIRICYPLIRLMGKNSSIKSTELAEAMFNIGMNGAQYKVLENKTIIEHLRTN